MRHLLDTSALLAHFRNEPGGVAVQALFEREDVVTFVSSITIAAITTANKAVLVHRDAHMRAIPSDQVEQLDLANNPAPG